MYGREQLEQDLAYLDSQRAEGARLLVANKINGFQKLDLDGEIDKAERSCRMKLAGVRMAITDRENMQKTGKMVYWKNRKGQFLMKRHGEPIWHPTSAAHLEMLRASGWFVIELKGFPPRDGVASMPEAELAPSLPPTLRIVTLEEGRRLANEGAAIVWRPDGKDCAAVVEYA